MDLPSWYAIILGGIVTTWGFFHVMYRLITYITVFVAFFVSKHLTYPHLFRRIPLVGAATRFEIVVIGLYLAANVLCITIGASMADISTRAANLAIVNLIPLLTGHRLTLMAEILGISLRTHVGLHKWFGRTVIAQVIVHLAISISKVQHFQWTGVNLSGVVSSSAFGLLFILSLHFFRRFMYEWFLRSHFVLSAAALIAIWRHVPSRKTMASIFLQIGAYLWIAVGVVHWVMFASRNLARGRPLARARIEQVSDALLVTVTVPRPWNVRAGQYVFLTVPRAALLSGLQSHPFMIAWWERSIAGLKISLLVKPRRGFTSNLAKCTNRTHLAFIDGPYGQIHDFGEYGTVVMFATGIGIAAQIPFIKDLVRGYNDCSVRTRRIVLVWQMEYEDHENWVRDWMTSVIHDDTGYILQIYLYVLRKTSSNGAKIGDRILYGKHSKLDKIFAPAEVKSILRREFNSRKGRMVVSVCAKNSMADKVRDFVQQDMDKDVRLVELEFQPSIRQTKIRSPTEMEFNCRGVV